MSLYLDATVGSVSANSYLSLDDAQDYFDARLYSEAWTEAASGVQMQSLIMATRQLDEEFNWNGTKTDEDQSLEWPRSGAYDCSDKLITSTVIPTEIKNATAEQALHLLKSDPTTYPDLLTKGFSEAKLDVMMVKTDVSKVPYKLSKNIVLCSNLGYRSNGTGSGVLIRGY